MQEHIPQYVSELGIAGVCSAFAGICGALEYLLKVEEGKPFSWRQMALHVSISGMCGLITYEILTYYGASPQLCGAFCGISGWMGTRLLRIVEVAIRKYFGVTKDDLK